MQANALSKKILKSKKPVPKIKAGSKRRRIRQWILLWIMVVTISLGWKYPLLGFSAPVVMLTGPSAFFAEDMSAAIFAQGAHFSTA